MEKKIDKVVALVQVPDYLPYNRRPHLLDYANENIKHIIPCVKVDGQYFDLRSNKKVERDESMEEWLVFTGTVFQYPDGKMFLVSRRYANQQLIILEMTEDIHPTMVLRKTK